MRSRPFIDSSVLVAAMVNTEAHHESCGQVLERGVAIYAHGIAETFSTLTGGRASFRWSAKTVVELLSEDYLSMLSVSALEPGKMLAAMAVAESRGIRGGAIFDYLHLVTARQAGARQFFTLDVSNFHAFHRNGDPEIMHP